MSEPRTVSNAAFEKLPLFATDKEIAVAVVGRTKADYWVKVILPSLERSGFPAKDPLHDARAVPLVKKFYDAYFGITSGIAMAKPDGEGRFGEWRRRRTRNDEPVSIIQPNPDRSGVIPPPTPEERRARAKAASDAWAEKKRRAREEFDAKRAVEAEAVEEQERKGRSRQIPATDNGSRILTRREAAALCKLTPAGFDVWVRKGIMPPATPGTRRWDRHAIDAALDQLSGLAVTDHPEEDAYEKWKRENGKSESHDSGRRKKGPGGYEIITDPNDPVKQQYDELGFDPATMGEKEMMELLKAADERWKASIPGTPLGKRESKSLLQLARFGVGVAIRANDIKGCRNDTAARLEARGFVTLQFNEHLPDYAETYVLTAAGLAAAQQIIENGGEPER